MIEYSTEKSSFLDRNKLYCQDVQSKLATLDYECSGTCTPFGYDLLSQFERNRLNFYWKFTKHQWSGGRHMPAQEYTGFEFKVAGFDSKYKFAIGESWIRRIFQSKEGSSIFFGDF